MLTSLEIENFKGIAARQRIDFAPLTLLFGANSAGKSTILQALLYLHELLERGSADVDRTELGGNVLELGGFARLVHRHEANRAIVLRAEFATPGGLERLGRDLSDFPYPDLDDDVESAWLELTIRFRTSSTFRGPLVERGVIGVNGESEPLVWIEVGSSLREGEPLLARVNLGHPVLATLRRNHPDLWSTVQQADTAPEGTPEVAIEELGKFKTLISDLAEVALPKEVVERSLGERTDEAGSPPSEGGHTSLGDPRWCPVFAVSRSRLSAVPTLDEPLRVLPFGDLEGDREEVSRLSRLPDSEENRRRRSELGGSIQARERATAHMRTLLEMTVLGTTGQLVSFLRDAMYIGPLRTIPPRGFLYERAGRITSWADGLAAWDLLLADRVSLVERTNLWLRRLGAGCQVVVQQLYDRGADADALSEGHVDKTARRLLLDTGNGSFVLPSEVGAGVSQIIPVVVAALEGRAGLTLVEQPEIHVHPAIQVGLGDLFIDAATSEGGRRTLLLETHSEHLILRILRRIRETHEGGLDGAAAVRPDEIAVLYIRAGNDGAEVVHIPITADGEFESPWPEGFFDERAKELF